ncbi:MAG: 2Fe-2S iron-sulfur cluster-binding protein [Actinomycetota bacterium]|jgi:aerobic-type carbon monoxide dehydrogenase small subunit (CoxS/CutS family)|nr:2Fe-2S iron-sulfur cluster-binding protein [Actinomycetota bacterium]
MSVAFRVDGRSVLVDDESVSLLDALRERLGVRSPKDGCSPQGQCGCCTVWIDGAPRVSCVTPVRRVSGREVTTTEGMSEERSRRWADAFVAAGASQCGFCTPGIVLRLAALESHLGRGARIDEARIRASLAAHLCRCTGWQSIVEAAGAVLAVPVGPTTPHVLATAAVRDRLLASWRAQLEGPSYQSSTRETVLGHAGFAEDTAPRTAVVAALRADGTPAFGADLVEARRASGKVQGRNSPVPLRHPVAVPDGDWSLVLRTTWVEPAYLEPDASWCVPGGRPATPLANGGAFGGKRRSPVAATARQLADERGEPVRVVWSREDVARRGPKRPPVALALRADGSGLLRVARTPHAVGFDDYVARVSALSPGLVVEPVDVLGPPVSPDLRGAGWAEVLVATAVLGLLKDACAAPGTPVEVTAPGGGRARVAVSPQGPVHVEVWAGEVLDEVVLRSFCLGAVHQALGWVRSEGISVDEAGEVQDLTIRSYGVLSARDTPWVDVTMHREDRWPVNGSDAVFAATAAAAWITDGLVPEWPTRRAERSAR